MTNYITQWWKQTKAKDRAYKVLKIRDSFYLKEKDGSVWILHDGVAVNQLPPFASTEEIVAILEETRTCAVEYAFGKSQDYEKKVILGDTFNGNKTKDL